MFLHHDPMDWTQVNLDHYFPIEVYYASVVEADLKVPVNYCLEFLSLGSILTFPACSQMVDKDETFHKVETNDNLNLYYLNIVRKIIE